MSTCNPYIEAVALALCQGRPLLLEGPTGAGKSAALEVGLPATGALIGRQGLTTKL